MYCSAANFWVDYQAFDAMHAESRRLMKVVPFGFCLR